MGLHQTRFMCEIVVFTLLISTTSSLLENPKFSEPIKNVTVPVGREAIFTCIVEDLGSYKVAWLRVDTQTILTIHNHLITKSNRFAVTHSENRTWYLHIRDIHEYDRGWYMCQINTDPMKSQIGYLDVVVPPDILDYPTSSDMIVREGSNVTLRCEAKGYPNPHIIWKREGGEQFQLRPQELHGFKADGSSLSIHRVSRNDMGPYLCIASNGIPPSVSKRIMLIVNFAPIIYAASQLLGAYDGRQVSLECHSEAFPRSINYWTKDNGEIVPQNDKFRTEVLERLNYRIQMKLTISNLSTHDYGTYHCITKNTMGEAEATIKIYRMQNFTQDNELPTKGAHQTHISEKEKGSPFLGDGYYSSAEDDYINLPLLATMLLSLVTYIWFIRLHVLKCIL